MPEVGGEVHLRAVREHLAHGDFLKTTGRSDPVTVGWAITALFYSALHAVRAYLKACKDVDVTSHEDYQAHARRFPELNRTQRDYDLLKQQSHSARYYCNPNFAWQDYESLRQKANRVANTWVPKAEGCLSGKSADSDRE